MLGIHIRWIALWEVEKMKCTSCYYARERYDSEGKVIGVDCAHDNMRFIEMETASIMYCGAWSEKDE